jgi:membrane-bound lytic murein transglycosylase A
VPLTAQRSVAVDPRSVPLGAPVFLATTWPNSNRPLNRLMLAQDTGGAIRGAVRADFFWGFGTEAAREAGRMKQPLRMWVLLPNGFPVPPGERQNR